MKGAYLIGEPGAGKSTLMSALTEHLDREPRTMPFAHSLLMRDDRVVAAELGAAHDTFPGTDRLSMNVQPRAVAWLDTAPASVVLGEGDRLATFGFIAALHVACSQSTVLWVRVPDDVGEQRRRERGSSQNAAWVRGRKTKVARLVDALTDYGVQVVALDGTRPVADLVAAARSASPAFAALS